MKSLVLVFLLAQITEDFCKQINEHDQVKELEGEGYKILEVSRPVFQRCGHKQAVAVTVTMQHKDDNYTTEYINRAMEVFEKVFGDINKRQGETNIQPVQGFTPMTQEEIDKLRSDRGIIIPIYQPPAEEGAKEAEPETPKEETKEAEVTTTKKRPGRPRKTKTDNKK